MKFLRIFFRIVEEKKPVIEIPEDDYFKKMKEQEEKDRELGIIIIIDC